jgi:hypothetical protein
MKHFVPAKLPVHFFLSFLVFLITFFFFRRINIQNEWKYSLKYCSIKITGYHVHCCALVTLNYPPTKLSPPRFPLFLYPIKLYLRNSSKRTYFVKKKKVYLQ